VRIDEAELQHLARLARIDLKPADAARLRQELIDVLGFVARLEEVEGPHTADGRTEPSGRRTPGDDRPRASLPVAAALEDAPEADDAWFRVPRVLDRDEG